MRVLTQTTQAALERAAHCVSYGVQGDIMRCQSDRSTWPGLCCVRVSPEELVLLADILGELAVKQAEPSYLQCSIGVRQDVQAWLTQD